MTGKLMIGFAALALGFGGVAQAQMAQTTTTETVRPNGSVHTVSRTTDAGGTSTTRTVDRPNGSREVVRHRAHSDRYRVCKTRWRHHKREHFCYWTHHRPAMGHRG